MDPGEYDESLDSDALNRSISADRARDPSAHSMGKSMCVPAPPVALCSLSLRSQVCVATFLV